VEGAPCPSTAALEVESRGDGLSLRVRLDHRAKKAVPATDAVQISESELETCELTGAHQGLQLGNSGLEPRSILAVVLR
jgi:hypothetical protein